MVSGLLVVDLVIMLVWQLQDPLQRRIETFSEENPESSSDDYKIVPELEHCESHNHNVWLGLFYAYKGLVLVCKPQTILLYKLLKTFSRFWIISCL